MSVEEQQLQGLQAQLASIVESADDGIISLDSSGRVITWNGGAERLFGYSAEEMVGRPYGEILEAGALELPFRTSDDRFTSPSGHW